VTFCGAVPKHGNHAAECEDRFATSDTRFAVADGASEGSYSHIWAQMLADAFCTTSVNTASDNVGPWLARCRHDWVTRTRQITDANPPWFTRASLQNGAFATFVGVAFSCGPSAAWNAVACGDACLFVVRDDAILVTFPVAAASGFDNTPPLAATSFDAGTDDWRVTTGIADVGDRFYLASDALGQWFLAQREQGGKPWLTLDHVRTIDALEAFAETSRDSGALRNDDVTLLSVRIDPRL
jgi:hypothetical protein